METQEAGLKTVNNTYMESHRILRTPSALVRDALLYIQEIGEMVCKEPRQNWRNSLDSYLLILVNSWGRDACHAGWRRGFFGLSQSLFPLL